MYVPRAMYSLSTSFWIVPASFAASAPFSSATSWYSSSRVDAGALIVIDVESLSRGRPPKRVRMSSIESIATPDLADLTVGDRLVGVVAHLGRQVEGHGQATGAVADELVVALVGLLRRAEARRTGASSRGARCTSTGRPRG